MQSNEVVEEKGIRITSTLPVRVVLRSPIVPEQSDEAYLALPVNLLGTDYYLALGYEEDISVRGFPGDEEPSQLSIAAVEQGTKVTIIPACRSLAGGGPGQPITVTLTMGKCGSTAVGSEGM